MKCKKHPKYQAIRKPTADCQPCRDMWVEKNTRVSMSEIAINWIVPEKKANG